MRRCNLIHFILVPFSCVGLGLGAMREDWWPRRIEIFKEYTLQSLLNQSCRDFVLWMAFRPSDQANEHVADLDDLLTSFSVPHVFTFDGLPYWDDKFNHGWMAKGLNCARILRGAWRERSLRGTLHACRVLFENRNGTLPVRLKPMLERLKQYDEAAAEWILLTRLDSDDMLHRDYAKEVQAADHFEGALVSNKGYVFDTPSRRLAHWEPLTCPPFFTLSIRKETFFDPQKQLAFWGGYRSHEDTPEVWETRKLFDGAYCVTTRELDMHVSTTWRHPWNKREIEDLSEIVDILKGFGQEKEPPIERREDWQQAICSGCGRGGLVPTGTCSVCPQCGTTTGCS